MITNNLVIFHDAYDLVKVAQLWSSSFGVYSLNQFRMSSLTQLKDFVKHELRNLKNETKPVHPDDSSINVIYNHLRSILSRVSDISTSENLVFEEDIAPLIPLLFDCIEYEKIGSLALVIIVKLNSAYQTEFETEVIDYFDDLIISCDSKNSKHEIFHKLTELFPVMTESCYTIWKMEEFVNLITNETSIILNAKDLQILHDRIFDILQLLSVSCMHNKIRDLIAKHFGSLPIRILKLSGANVKDWVLHSLSALIIVKLWNSFKPEFLEKNKDFLTLDLLIETLANGILNCDDETSNDTDVLEQTSVEGLVYLSLNVKVKQQLRKDDNFISALFDNLDKSSSKPRQLLFGYLNILTNITTFNKILTKSQESMQFLKNYANVNHQTGKREEIEKDNDEEIETFIKSSLDKSKFDFDLINFLNILLKEDSKYDIRKSKGLQAQVVKLIYNYSFVSKSRTEIVKRGALVILLTYLISTSSGINYTKAKYTILANSTGSLNIDQDTRLMALQALSKVLMSNNPNLIFKEFSIVTPIPFLNEIIVQYNVQTNGNQYGDDFVSTIDQCELTPMDVFEALVALVNLSSVDSNEVKQVMCRICLASIIDLLLTPDSQIQRSILELLCNLISTPTCLKEFFDWQVETKKGDSYNNFIILTKLMDSFDVQSQVAVLNIFANASDYQMISLMLSDHQEFLDRIINILKDQTEEEDLVIRCFYILLHVCESVKEVRPASLETFHRKKEIKLAVLTAVAKHRTDELKAIGSEICNIL